MRLIQLCKQEKVDMILTKSISRFSRNTLECIEYIRMLKDRGIAVIFEKEGINTMEMASEMLLSVLGSFAQAESESLSKNVSWGKRQSFKNGNVPFVYSKQLRVIMAAKILILKELRNPSEIKAKEQKCIMLIPTAHGSEV